MKVPRFQKHWIVDSLPRFLPENVTILDKIQEHRFESLLAVDDMVESIVNNLKEKSLLEKTYFILMSDNGFHLGKYSNTTKGVMTLHCIIGPSVADLLLFINYIFMEYVSRSSLYKVSTC